MGFFITAISKIQCALNIVLDILDTSVIYFRCGNYLGNIWIHMCTSKKLRGWTRIYHQPKGSLGFCRGKSSNVELVTDTFLIIKSFRKFRNIKIWVFRKILNNTFKTHHSPNTFRKYWIFDPSHLVPYRVPQSVNAFYLMFPCMSCHLTQNC